MNQLFWKWPPGSRNRWRGSASVSQVCWWSWIETMVTLCFLHTETTVPRPLSPTGHPAVTLQVPARCYRKSISACHMPMCSWEQEEASHTCPWVGSLLVGALPGACLPSSPVLRGPPAAVLRNVCVCVCVFVAGGSCGVQLHSTSCPMLQKHPHWVASVVSPCEVVKPCRQNVLTIYTSVKVNILDRCLHMGLPCMLEVTRILVLSG